MAFHDELFPVDISYGSSGGTGFNTAIIATRSDAEQRIPRRQIPRRSWDAAYGVKSRAQAAAMVSFYVNRMGAAHSFKYKDFNEFTTASDHVSAPDDEDVTLGSIPAGGAPYTFQAKKTFVSGSSSLTQDLKMIADGTTVIAVNGVALGGGDFSINLVTGEITITSSHTEAETVTFGCEYYHHVRFAQAIDGLLSVEINNPGSLDIPSIPLIEVLEEDAVNDQRVMGGGRYYGDEDQVSLDTGAYSYAFDPDGASGATTAAVLQDPTTLDAGGPYFVVKNVGAVGDLLIEYPAATTLVSLLPGESALLYIGLDASLVNTWEYLS